MVHLNDDAFLSFSDKRIPRTLDYVSVCHKLSKKQKNQILHVVSLFQDVFLDDPGVITLVEHGIELTIDEHVGSKLYPLPFSVRDIANDEIIKMLELGVNEWSDSPYVSQIILVRRKYISNGCCVDYRTINRVTIFGPEPMPKPFWLFCAVNFGAYIYLIISYILSISRAYWITDSTLPCLMLYVMLIWLVLPCLVFMVALRLLLSYFTNFHVGRSEPSLCMTYRMASSHALSLALVTSRNVIYASFIF